MSEFEAEVERGLASVILGVWIGVALEQHFDHSLVPILTCDHQRGSAFIIAALDVDAAIIQQTLSFLSAIVTNATEQLAHEIAISCR